MIRSGHEEDADNMHIHGRRDVRRALLGAAAVASLAACGGSAANATTEDEGFVKVVNVEVASLAARPFAATVRVTGEARPATDVTVSAEEGGRLVAFVREKGSMVARGGTVARIDDAVVAAQAQEARAAARLAEDRYVRQRRLWEEEGIGSEIAYLQSQSEAEAAAARLALAETRLARTRIRAPVAGTVDEHLVEAGEVVAAGTPVARIVDGRRLEIAGGVPERFAAQVAPGDSAQITFDVLPGRTFGGTINYVGAAVDRQSRTFPIEIAMDNPDGAVKPYMIANVRVIIGREEDAIVVPREVLLRTEMGQQAVVVESRDGEDVAVLRDVVLGTANQNDVVVTAGLQPGDRLVVRGQQLVDPGDRVRIVGGSE